MDTTTFCHGGLCSICGEIDSTVKLRTYEYSGAAFVVLGCRGCLNAVEYTCNLILWPVPRGILASRIALILRRMLLDGELTIR